MPVNVKLNHKDWRFLLYENRELKFFYAISVHSESMNHAVFLFRDRMFSCQAPFFSFPGRNMVWSACLGFLLVHRTLWHSPLTVPTNPALGHDFSWLCSSLTSHPVLDGSMYMLLGHDSVSICLYAGALAYCVCRLQQQFKGLCRAGETTRSGGLCAAGNRPVTCLMKVVRRQIWRFASPHSGTMS